MDENRYYEHCNNLLRKVIAHGLNRGLKIIDVEAVEGTNETNLWLTCKEVVIEFRLNPFKGFGEISKLEVIIQGDKMPILGTFPLSKINAFTLNEFPVQGYEGKHNLFDLVIPPLDFKSHKIALRKAYEAKVVSTVDYLSEFGIGHEID